MNSVDYKQKYLKYKNKYLELKALEESKLNLQTGGVVYTPGEYVFFIPEDKIQFDTNDTLIDKNGNINEGLDRLTNYLGNCTKFLRVGKTSTGYDFSNTYNTLYTNQGSASVIQREANTAYTNVKETTNKAVEALKKGSDVAIKKMNDLGKKTSNNEVPLSINEVPPSINKDPSSINKDPSPMTGGEKCDATPIKLDKGLLIGSTNEYESTKLLKIVKLINEKQPSNKIKKIIYVKKPLVPGKPSIIEKSKTLTLEYAANGEVSVV